MDGTCQVLMKRVDSGCSHRSGENLTTFFSHGKPGFSASIAAKKSLKSGKSQGLWLAWLVGNLGGFSEGMPPDNATPDVIICRVVFRRR